MNTTINSAALAALATAAGATPETKRKKLMRRGGPTNASNSRKGRPAFRPMPGK